TEDQVVGITRQQIVRTIEQAIVKDLGQHCFDVRPSLDLRRSFDLPENAQKDLTIGPTANESRSLRCKHVISLTPELVSDLQRAYGTAVKTDQLQLSCYWQGSDLFFELL